MKKWEWLSEKTREACEFGDSAMRMSCETIDGLIIDYEKLKEENESLRKDAERYRWLRASKHFDSPQHRAFCEFYTDGLDCAIDAAISSPENP